MEATPNMYQHRRDRRRCAPQSGKQGDGRSVPFCSVPIFEFCRVRGCSPGSRPNERAAQARSWELLDLDLEPGPEGAGFRADKTIERKEAVFPVQKTALPARAVCRRGEKSESGNSSQRPDPLTLSTRCVCSTVGGGGRKSTSTRASRQAEMLLEPIEVRQMPIQPFCNRLAYQSPSTRKMV